MNPTQKTTQTAIWGTLCVITFSTLLLLVAINDIGLFSLLFVAFFPVVFLQYFTAFYLSLIAFRFCGKVFHQRQIGIIPGMIFATLITYCFFRLFIFSIKFLFDINMDFSSIISVIIAIAIPPLFALICNIRQR